MEHAIVFYTGFSLVYTKKCLLMYAIYFLNPKTKIKAHKWITTYVCV